MTSPRSSVQSAARFGASLALALMAGAAGYWTYRVLDPGHVGWPLSAVASYVASYAIVGVLVATRRLPMLLPLAVALLLLWKVSALEIGCPAGIACDCWGPPPLSGLPGVGAILGALSGSYAWRAFDRRRT